MGSRKLAMKIMVVGPTGCGKSYYVLEMIEKEFKGKFDYICIICPTLEWNDAYVKWKYRLDPCVVGVFSDLDDMELELRKAWHIYKGSNTLIIVDDCASTTEAKKQAGELAKQVMIGRHAGISTIIISQQLTSISKVIRDNLTRLIVFWNGNRDDMTNVMNCYLYGTPPEEIKRLFDELMVGKYVKLDITLGNPSIKRLIYPDNNYDHSTMPDKRSTKALAFMSNLGVTMGVFALMLAIYDYYRVSKVVVRGY